MIFLPYRPLLHGCIFIKRCIDKHLINSYVLIINIIFLACILSVTIWLKEVTNMMCNSMVVVSSLWIWTDNCDSTVKTIMGVTGLICGEKDALIPQTFMFSKSVQLHGAKMADKKIIQPLNEFRQCLTVHVCKFGSLFKSYSSLYRTLVLKTDSKCIFILYRLTA